EVLRDAARVLALVVGVPAPRDQRPVLPVGLGAVADVEVDARVRGRRQEAAAERVVAQRDRREHEREARRQRSPGLPSRVTARKKTSAVSPTASDVFSSCKSYQIEGPYSAAKHPLATLARSDAKRRVPFAMHVAPSAPTRHCSTRTSPGTCPKSAYTTPRK